MAGCPHHGSQDRNSNRESNMAPESNMARESNCRELTASTKYTLCQNAKDKLVSRAKSRVRGTVITENLKFVHLFQF